MSVQLEQERRQPLVPSPVIDNDAGVRIDERLRPVAKPDLVRIDVWAWKLHELHTNAPPPRLDLCQNVGALGSLVLGGRRSYGRTDKSVVRVAKQQQPTTQRHREDDGSQNDADPSMKPTERRDALTAVR